MTTKQSSSPKPVPTWQVVENVVAAIESVRTNVPGIDVTQKAMVEERGSTQRREVDVLIEIPVGDRVLRIGVDVKNESRPLTIEVMEQLGAKAAKLDLDRYCVVSTSGFSEAGAQDARARGIEATTVEEFVESDFWQYPPLATLRKLALVRCLFVYDDPAAAQHHFLGDAGEEPVVSDGSTSRPLRAFAHHFGSQALDQLQPSPKDGEEFGVEVRIDSENLEFHLAGVQLPAPRALKLTFRFTITTTPERRFRLAGIEAVTHEQEMHGEMKQVTILAIPVDASGAKRVAISVAPAQPARTPV